MKHSLDVMRSAGCPWHGLIEGGELFLPNGQTMAMRQPNSFIPFERGNTSLISLPSAPGATRTPEEQQADTLAGMQWLDKAILTCDQLHGQAIGSGRWIYHDADGANWLVDPGMHGYTGDVTSATVTLKRFGVFGGEPALHSYTVSVPGVQAARLAYALQLNNVMLRQMAVHPQGRAAVFAVLARFSGTDYTTPIAWLEMTLSGAGGECAVAMSVVHDAQATRGEVTHNDSTNLGTYRQAIGVFPQTTVNDTTVQNYPNCAGTYNATTSYSIGLDPQGLGQPRFSAFPGGTFTGRRAVNGCVVGMCYSAAGVRQDMTLEAELDYSVTASAPAVIENVDRIYEYNVVAGVNSCQISETQKQAGRLQVRQTATTTAEGRIALRVGGAVVTERSISYTTQRTNTLRMEDRGFPGDNTPSVRVLDMNWQTSRSTDDAVNYTSTSGGDGGAFPLGSTWTGLDISTDLVRTPSLFGTQLSGAPDNLLPHEETMTRHSATVLGFVTLRRADNNAYPHEYSFRPTLATPDGAATAAQVTLTRAAATDPVPFLYGSHNPITGQAARSLTPVCWT